MQNFEDMTLAELREYLVNNCEYSESEVKEIKNKKAALNILNDYYSSLDYNLDNVEVEEETVGNNHEDIMEHPPRIDSPEWTDFLLSELRDDEMYDGNPKADGLRRLVEEYMGRIVESTTEQIITHPNAVTILHKIKVLTGDGVTEVFSRCADAVYENTPFPFNKHLSATAETKAEGRCYRKILRLNAPAAEELFLAENNNDGGGINEGLDSSNQPITSLQKTLLTQLCGDGDRGENINVFKLAQEILDKEIKNVKELTRDDATELTRAASEYQNKDIPTELKGYDATWLN